MAQTKMFSRLCLLVLVLVLTGVLGSPVNGRTPLPVNNTQDVYQAEEHSNLTLTLSVVNTTSDFLSIMLKSMETQKNIYMYHSKSQPDPLVDDEFRGRLQCEAQLDGSGRIECVLTDLRTNDTGSYELVVKVRGKAGERRHNKKFELKVVKASEHQTTEAALKHQQTPEETPEDRERIWVYIALVAFLVVLLFFTVLYFSIKCCKNHCKKQKPTPSSSPLLELPY